MTKGRSSCASACPVSQTLGPAGIASSIVACLWLAISLLLLGCGRHNGPAKESPDAILRSRLAGTWAIEGLGAMTLGIDGTFSSRWTNSHASPEAVWQYDGLWTTTPGAFVMTSTNSQSWGTTNRVPAGDADVYKILALDEHELVWETGGQTYTFKRTK